MPSLISEIKDCFIPNILQVTEEGRLFILLRNLGLIKNLNVKFTDPKKEKLNRFHNYHVLVKIPQIESLADRNIITDPRLLAINKLHKRVTFVFDLSTESITFTEYTSKMLLKFHEALHEYGVNPKKIILICANRNAEHYYQEWLKKNFYNNYRIKIIGFNFYLYEYFTEVKACEWLQKHSSHLINSSLETVEKGIKRKKHYLCLNLRPRKHRTAVLLHLLQRGHLAKGNVTYFGDEFAEHQSVDQTSDRFNFINQLPSNKRLIPLIPQLDSITPLLLDKNSTSIKKDLWDRKPGKVEFLIPEADNIESGIETYFEIVTETWLTDRSNFYITEKTIRPILRLQPFLHIGSPGLMKYLREIGFQTFSPFIDETYDEIDDPILRLEVIFNEIDRLCNKSIDEIHQLYCDLWPRVLHNYNHFKTNMIRIAEDEIGTEILKKISSNYKFRETYE